MTTTGKYGDWYQARAILRHGAAKVNNAIDKAVLQEAHWFRKKVVRGITRQNPGGQQFKKLAKNTIATRRATGVKGRKALIKTGELRNSIVVVKRAGGVFVGVPRAARGKDGKSLVKVAELHEFGSRPIVIKITPKMAKFLAAVLGKKTTGKGGSTGFVVTQIPARPFLRPVMDKHGKPDKVRRRMQLRLATLLEGKFGV